MFKRVTVKIPATTANIGPGFDVLAMALNLYNTVELEKQKNSGFQIEIAGEGEDILPKDSRNLVVKTIKDFFDRVGYYCVGWKLRLLNKIPLERGLGSSAAAIVGGLLAANALAGSPFSSEEILLQAIEIEGHPDNVAAAILGGVVIVVKEGSSYLYTRFSLPEGIKIYAVVPSFCLSTKTARAVLPDAVPLKDAVFNLGRVALLVNALMEGRWDLLQIAVKDRIHQPYRCALIPGFEEVLKAASQAGAYGAVLSGAGPTVIALAPPDSGAGEAMREVLKSYGIDARVWELEPSLCGAHIVDLE